MKETQSYRIVETGKHSTRRDYSKVSGSLELPNLVEIQTDSFDWFKNEGIRGVFEDIYPISNYHNRWQNHPPPMRKEFPHPPVKSDCQAFA